MTKAPRGKYTLLHKYYSVTLTTAIGLGFEPGDVIPTGKELRQLLASNIHEQIAMMEDDEVIDLIDRARCFETRKE